MNEEHPIIRYVPGHPSINRYDPYNEVVVLDENVKDYPLAHEHIRRHELDHYAGETFLEQLRHELMTDLYLHFSMDETAREIRDYLSSSGENVGFIEFQKNVYANMIRSLWQTVFYPAGRVYRWWYDR